MSHPSKVKGNDFDNIKAIQHDYEWDGELWFRVSRYPDYCASPSGRIARFSSCKTRSVPRVLTSSVNGVDYALCKLSKNGKKYPEKVHRIVCETFHGEKPFQNAHVCHNNGNPSDNRAINLRWDTCAGNHADKVKHGTDISGNRNGRSKLTWDDVVDIRSKFTPGYGNIARFARQYKMSHSQMWEIVNSKSWIKHE